MTRHRTAHEKLVRRRWTRAGEVVGWWLGLFLADLAFGVTPPLLMLPWIVVGVWLGYRLAACWGPQR